MDQSELESRISNDPSPVTAARELLKGRYDADAEAFRQGADVRALVRSRADTVDTVLRLIWNRYPFSDSPDIALIAVGGYGRGELHPHSDIDLLILTRAGIEDSWHEDLGAKDEVKDEKMEENDGGDRKRDKQKAKGEAQRQPGKKYEKR